MSWIKAAFLTGVLSSMMVNFTPDSMAAEWAWGQGRGGCQRGDRLNIQDLDMSPDPLVEGQRVRAWKVRVDFSGRRDCETDILVREGNNIVGHARNYKLRPGVNEVEIPAVESFRYTGREHCFNVQVDLDGSRQQVDAARRFCARQRTMWSMREPDDRGRAQYR
ncbi:MAG TPA: hypothetical protein VFK65_15280 [Candidatus Binatia bacterium]|nr:hypothetical protein [Candidatus Binatia bacterium]